MNHNHAHFDKFLRIVFGTLIILLVILAAVSFTDYRHLRAVAAFRMQQRHATLPVSDTSFVQSWMTYDYIGHVYNLPPDYLKTTLSIADTRYPRVTIAESAEAQHLSVAEMTTDVQNAIAIANATSTPAP